MRDVCAVFFFFQAEDGIRDYKVTGVQTCALPISGRQAPHGGPLARDRAARRGGESRRPARTPACVLHHAAARRRRGRADPGLGGLRGGAPPPNSPAPRRAIENRPRAPLCPRPPPPRRIPVTR